MSNPVEQFRDAITLLVICFDTLTELSHHPAFEGDAPEFVQDGIGHENLLLLREFLIKHDCLPSYWETV